MERFHAIDVETANRKRSSICQIGVVLIEDGRIVREKGWLVNPREPFEEVNTRVHGLKGTHVENEPTWKDTGMRIAAILEGSIVVSHTGFDRRAVEQANRKQGIGTLAARWVDSAKMAQKTWPDQFGTKGYGLAEVAGYLGIRFKHHDAVEDARAAALIALKACSESGIPIEQWAGTSPRQEEWGRGNDHGNRCPACRSEGRKGTLKVTHGPHRTFVSCSEYRGGEDEGCKHAERACEKCNEGIMERTEQGHAKCTRARCGHEAPLCQCEVPVAMVIRESRIGRSFWGCQRGVKRRCGHTEKLKEWRT